jgi:hypothetical protein
MRINKDEMIKKTVEEIMSHLTSASLDDRETVEKIVYERVTEWQLCLANEVVRLSAKIPTTRSEYLVGLEDSVAIINGSVDMEPLGNIDIFAVPTDVSADDVAKLADDYAKRHPLDEVE